VISTRPTGLGVVRVATPSNLREKYSAIVAEFLAIDYSVLDADNAGMLASTQRLGEG